MFSLSPKVFVGLFVLVIAASAGVFLFSASSPISAASGPTVTIYKSSSCGCCTSWMEHMREAGFQVESVNDPDLAIIKADHHVPRHLTACHTASVEGYTVEGHVPASAIKRMLSEKPQIAGIGVGGMPKGSPGMPGMPEHFEVESFTREGATAVWSSHGPGR